jgi:prepilin-type N-terminal cleavage/methylation domain-containing protein
MCNFQLRFGNINKAASCAIAMLSSYRQRQQTFIFIEESLTVAMRPPKYNSQGFTLIEMLVTIVIAGIIMGFALPSFLSLSKPLRDGSLEFKAQLSLIRSKAIAGNQAYRIRPKFSTTASAYADGSRARNFVVEYASNCTAPENTATVLSWQAASQLDLDLPANVGITDITSTVIPDPSIGTVSNNLNWNGGKGICFDNRGIVATATKFILKDFRGDNRARIAVFEVGKVGNVDITTYDNNIVKVPENQGNPAF